MSTFVLKNLHRLFDKYAVVHTEQDPLVKSTMKIFSNFVAFSENPNFIWREDITKYKVYWRHARGKVSAMVTWTLVARRHCSLFTTALIRSSIRFFLVLLSYGRYHWIKQYKTCFEATLKELHNTKPFLRKSLEQQDQKHRCS